MNARAEVLQEFEGLSPRERRAARATVTAIARTKSEWNPEAFAREQIRGLVRQVFFGKDSKATRQVVFSAIEAETDVSEICERVGYELSLETRSHVAIVRRQSQIAGVDDSWMQFSRSAAIKSWSTQLSANLWRVPGFGRIRDHSENSGTGPHWLSCLGNLRNEFEYAVIQAPSAGVSSEAAMLGQLADGIILVLDAHSTRKAPARKIKELLGAQSRILGAVLSARRFPVPDRIYRRL